MAEKDYGGGAGYATRQDPETVASPDDRIESMEWRHEVIPLIPTGRALDEADLYDMIEEGNQRSRAILLRKSLCEYAVRSLKSTLVLSTPELEILETHRQHRAGRLARPTDVPLPHVAPIDPWPKGRG